MFNKIHFLERRLCLASTLNAGVLTVSGDSAANAIEVEAFNMTGPEILVRIDGVEERFPSADVTTISVFAGDGNDTVSTGTLEGKQVGVSGEGGDDTLVGGNLSLGIFSVRLNGGAGNDSISGGTGFDVLIGGGGNDTLLGNAGGDSLDGGAGMDSLDGGSGSDELDGGTGADTLRGSGGSDQLRGDEDSDLLDGGSGFDRLFGGDNADTLLGGGDNDFLTGQGGGDSLDGGSGNDRIEGGKLSDTLFGQGGSDLMTGESRNDGDTSPDMLVGGSGEDEVYYPFGTSAVTITTGDGLANDGHTGENDSIGTDFEIFSLTVDDDRIDFTGNPGRHRVKASTGNDTLIGGPGADELLGDQGNDSITGAGGEDRLLGGFGEDILIANDGIADIVNGGGDNDTAMVDNGLDSVLDVETVN